MFVKYDFFLGQLPFSLNFQEYFCNLFDSSYAVTALIYNAFKKNMIEIVSLIHFKLGMFCN